MEHPTKKELEDFFYFVDGCLFWKKGSRSGMETGYAGLRGCLETRFKYKLYKTHRLIWILHYGEIPTGMVIDHIDGNAKNNSLENLRLTTQRVNTKNQRKRITNTSGHMGVYLHKQRGKWVAEIKVNYKKKYLGIFQSKEEAISARVAAEKQYGFHENHGRAEKS